MQFTATHLYSGAAKRRAEHRSLDSPRLILNCRVAAVGGTALLARASAQLARATCPIRAGGRHRSDPNSPTDLRDATREALARFAGPEPRASRSNRPERPWRQSSRSLVGRSPRRVRTAEWPQIRSASYSSPSLHGSYRSKTNYVNRFGLHELLVRPIVIGSRHRPGGRLIAGSAGRQMQTKPPRLNITGAIRSLRHSDRWGNRAVGLSCKTRRWASDESW